MKKRTILTLTFALGVLYSWSQTLTSSHLPIVVINTGNATFNDATIPDDPKITASMGIIDNGPGATNNLTDPFNSYSGSIGIETRGNSTQDFDKKTYSLELRTNAGADSSVALMGMGKEEDWILHAMVIDKTQLRIPMSFYLARRSGHYASDWRYVELVIDNDYRGLYIMCERLKRDNDRVDIAKLDADDLAGDSVTGGYILRIDWLDGDPGFASNYNSLSGTDPMFYQYYYPKPTNIQPAQEAYIQGYMDDFEDAVFANNYTNSSGLRYNDYIDVTSFVDFLLINEFSKNSDGYKLSSYLHKDKESKGGKLKAGPIWDFDQTYGMSEVCSCSDFTGWTYLQSQPQCEDLESMPAWWDEMMQDTLFTNHLACRWSELRAGPFHLDSINDWIDDHEQFLGSALTRNFTKWQFIGQQIWYQPEPVPTTYAEEVLDMKNWIASRLAWMDANMPGNCSNDVVSVGELKPLEFSIYPNPASETVNIAGPAGAELQVFSVQGKLIVQKELNSDISSLDISEFPRGMYFVQAILNGQKNTKKLVVR